MSLELALQENTAAVNALIQAIKSVAATPMCTNTSEILSNDKIEAKTEVKVAEVKGKPKAEPKGKPEPKGAPELTYAEVGPVLLELAKANRPALVELLKEFGVAKGSELTPDQFADVKAKAEALLNPTANAEEDLV